MGKDHPPDAQLFPHATGAAEQMVKAHQKEEPLKLYSGWFCPFVQRVLLVLLEKNIPFQYIEVSNSLSLYIQSEFRTLNVKSSKIYSIFNNLNLFLKITKNTLKQNCCNGLKN